MARRAHLLRFAVLLAAFTFLPGCINVYEDEEVEFQDRRRGTPGGHADYHVTPFHIIDAFTAKQGVPWDDR